MESPIDWKIGDACVVHDYSEAHGDAGTIYVVQDNGLILVELEECLWPVEATGIKRLAAVESQVTFDPDETLPTFGRPNDTAQPGSVIVLEWT